MVWTLAIIAVIVIIASVLSIVIKNFSHFESKPYLRDQGETAQVLVLCYSRNGNTEAMAKEIAKYHDADLKFIEAESYSRDFTGWYNAFIDASNETETIINPETIDMSSYDLIFLGSPIWLFRPAPPIWTFVRNNDFTNNKVILFNTFNSRFEQENIDEFGDLIVSKGGTLIDHIYIRRGRATPLQKDGNDVIMETMEILKQQWGNKVSDSSTQ